MIKSLSVLLVLVATSIGYADTKSGEAKLQELKSGETKDGLKISLGKKIKVDCNYYINPDFLGRKTISVQARLQNTSDKEMYYGYFVAFFDKDKNLVATSNFGGGTIAKLAAGKDTYIGNVMQVPITEIPRIAYYQVTLLEDDKEFGK